MFMQSRGDWISEAGMARVDEKIHGLFERVRAQRAAPVLVPVFESIFVRAVYLRAKIKFQNQSLKST